MQHDFQNQMILIFLLIEKYAHPLPVRIREIKGNLKICKSFFLQERKEAVFFHDGLDARYRIVPEEEGRLTPIQF